MHDQCLMKQPKVLLKVNRMKPQKWNSSTKMQYSQGMQVFIPGQSKYTIISLRIKKKFKNFLRYCYFSFQSEISPLKNMFLKL